MRLVYRLLIIFAVPCPDLTDPENGQVAVNGFAPGDIATYTCNSGYSLSGPETRECQDDSNWSGVVPTCIRK